VTPTRTFGSSLEMSTHRSRRRLLAREFFGFLGPFLLTRDNNYLVRGRRKPPFGPKPGVIRSRTRPAEVSLTHLTDRAATGRADHIRRRGPLPSASRPLMKYPWARMQRDPRSVGLDAAFPRTVRVQILRWPLIVRWHLTSMYRPLSTYHSSCVCHIACVHRRRRLFFAWRRIGPITTLMRPPLSINELMLDSIHRG